VLGDEPVHRPQLGRFDHLVDPAVTQLLLGANPLDCGLQLLRRSRHEADREDLPIVGEVDRVEDSRRRAEALLCLPCALEILEGRMGVPPEVRPAPKSSPVFTRG
jgi:hypothetical protein